MRGWDIGVDEEMGRGVVVLDRGMWNRGKDWDRCFDGRVGGDDVCLSQVDDRVDQ